MTKKGYSADAAWKPLTDPGDNADEDGADGVHVKAATLRSNAEAFLTKRHTKGKGLGYDVRSPPYCKKNMTIVVYNGESYKHYTCKSHSKFCTSGVNLRGKCEAVVTYIPGLKDTYTSDCQCKTD